MEDLFAKLNEEQIEAVTATEGVIRVIAGAGSGKTRALSHRFAFLVNEVGIRPGNILCVTFTNKAASEMRQRIHALTGDNDTGMINTFHGFCVSVLQEDGHALNYPKSFLVLDNSDIDSMLKIIYEERNLSLRDMTFAQARDYFEMRKGLYEPDYYLDLVSMSAQELYQKYLDAEDVKDILFYGYLWQEKKCFGLDYNDLIFLTLYLFKKEKEICRKWQKRLEYIMIDEFQDIDPPQYELMKVLCGYHHNLFAVGDPDQTIYTWRGANIRFLMDLDRQYPDTKTIFMMKNYRSTPQVIACSNSLIEKNHRRIKKELIPMRENGVPVFYHHSKSTEDEGKWIAEKVKELHEQGIPYRDMTLLYRAHYVTRAIEDVFLKEEVPYTIYSGIQFFARTEIKDALAYLRMIAYQDDLSFARIVNVPRRNVGKRRMSFLQEYADRNSCTLYQALQMTIEDEIFRGTKAKQFIDLIESFRNSCDGIPVSEILARILDRSGYEKMLRTEGAQDRLDDLAELKQSVYNYETTCGEETDLMTYLRHIAFFTNNDLEEKQDKVKLMTIHAAKGLEFSRVFLCGMNEGILPGRKTASISQMEEERRLAFVAMTRAEDALYLSDAEGRNFDNTTRYVSRFITDIDPELYESDTPLSDSLVKAMKEEISMKDRNLMPDEEDMPFKEGDTVTHPIFGRGVVEKIDRKEAAVFVKFHGMETARGIAFRALSKLKKEE